MQSFGCLCLFISDTSNSLFNQRLPSLSSSTVMSLFNNLIKASVAAGITAGAAVAYAQLNEEQRGKLKRGVNSVRRKLADIVAPSEDGVIYDLPKEVEAELNALIND